MLDRDGKNYVVHPNKGGYVYVYNRDVSSEKLKIENVWHLGKTSNYVKDVDPKTGELIGRRELKKGMNRDIVPGDRRRHQLEFRQLQSGYRALLQDRPGVLRRPGGGEDRQPGCLQRQALPWRDLDGGRPARA